MEDDATANTLSQSRKDKKDRKKGKKSKKLAAASASVAELSSPTTTITETDDPFWELWKVQKAQFEKKYNFRLREPPRNCKFQHLCLLGRQLLTNSSCSYV